MAAYTRAVTVRDSLVLGIPFADLAVRNSDDVGSNSRGGDLGWFGRVTGGPSLLTKRYFFCR